MAVTGSRTQAWGGNSQMTGVAGGIDMGGRDGANGADKAGSSTWGMEMQAKGKGRGSRRSPGNFSRAWVDSWSAVFGKGWAQCKDCFVADMGHVCCRDLVVGSRSQVLGSEKGGEG